MEMLLDVLKWSGLAGAAALALTLLKPLLDRRYSARWRYWVWLALAALLLAAPVQWEALLPRVEAPGVGVHHVALEGAVLPCLLTDRVEHGKVVDSCRESQLHTAAGGVCRDEELELPGEVGAGGGVDADPRDILVAHVGDPGPRRNRAGVREGHVHPFGLSNRRFLCTLRLQSQLLCVLRIVPPYQVKASFHQHSNGLLCHPTSPMKGDIPYTQL